MLLDSFFWFILNISGRQNFFKLKFFYDINFIKNSKELDIILLNRILFIYFNSIDHIYLGTPILKDFKIEAYVIQHFFGKKILIFRYKRKKNSKKLKGYKSLYTRIFTNNLIYGT